MDGNRQFVDRWMRGHEGHQPQRSEPERRNFGLGCIRWPAEIGGHLHLSARVHGKKVLSGCQDGSRCPQRSRGEMPRQHASLILQTRKSDLSQELRTLAYPPVTFGGASDGGRSSREAIFWSQGKGSGAVQEEFLHPPERRVKAWLFEAESL